MKKRHLISAIAMFLALMMLGLSCGALADSKNGGTLSYLNMTEEEDEAVSESVRVPILKILFLNGVFVPENDQGQNDSPCVVHFYDTLDTMLMALQSGELDSIKVPYYTARYLCSTNDGLKMSLEYHPEKATGISELALSTLSNGYAFMLKEENVALCDELDAQITAMKEDGTLQKLIDEHIIKVSEGGEPEAIAFEKFEGNPIKVAVTGSLPPMDYMAAMEALPDLTLLCWRKSANGCKRILSWCRSTASAGPWPCPRVRWTSSSGPVVRPKLWRSATVTKPVPVRKSWMQEMPNFRRR